MIIKKVANLTDREKAHIWELLQESEQSFVPPLSCRNSTKQNSFQSEKAENGLQSYYDSMMAQEFILAYENDRVVGFMTYIENYHLPYENETVAACDYISTIIVKPAYQHQGICMQMYKELFSVSDANRFATRTWSQNYAHIGLLMKLNFIETYRIADDRGKGIDTVYFAKECCGRKDNEREKENLGDHSN